MPRPKSPLLVIQMLQKDSERESEMVIDFDHCVQKRSKERETGSEGVGDWEMGNESPA